MWPFKARSPQYQAVASDDTDSKDPVEGLEPVRAVKASGRRRLVLILGGLGFVVLLIALGVSANIAEQWTWSSHKDAATASGEEPNFSARPSEVASPETPCQRRREWRTLSTTEQQDYISAVLCLRTKPSRIAPESNKTAYDDWPWIHSHVGYYSHHTASFLPWHRYFLHLYETTLREHCNYDGGLVYWDWTLDSDAIEHSPVFDPDTGFGGDGEIGGEITVSNTGRCIVDGPFAGIVADYYDVKYKPHCLSRGFRDLDGSLGHIDGSDITPESMEEVLSSETYEDFVKLMESRVHDAIPYGISGDFETFTAPYGMFSAVDLSIYNTDLLDRSALLPTPYSARSPMVVVAAKTAWQRVGVLQRTKRSSFQREGQPE